MPTDAIGSGLPWIDAIARSFEMLSFVEFNRVRLPKLNTCHGSLAAADLAGAPPLGFRVDEGDAFTWIPAADGLRVVEGESDAETLVALSERTFSEFVQELLTAAGAARTGRAKLARGNLAGWQRWEPALQSLCSGRAIYGPEVWRTLEDRAGRPLDLGRRFQVGDDPDEMRHYFEAAGFLHLRGVFSPGEIERLGAEVEYVRSETTPGDPFSWWSVNRAGKEVVYCEQCGRILYRGD